MADDPTHLHLTGVDLRLTEPNTDDRVRPILQVGTIALTNDGFTTIVRRLLRDEIVLPFVTLSYVSSRLIPGGAEITVFARTAILQHNVRARLALSLAETGNLRVQIVDVRAGLFPVTRLLEPLLGNVDRQPGLHRSGPRAIDVNIAELLEARRIPLTLAAGIRWVSATPDALTIEFG